MGEGEAKGEKYEGKGQRFAEVAMTVAHETHLAEKILTGTGAGRATEALKHPQDIPHQTPTKCCGDRSALYTGPCSTCKKMEHSAQPLIKSHKAEKRNTNSTTPNQKNGSSNPHFPRGHMAMCSIMDCQPF